MNSLGMMRPITFEDLIFSDEPYTHPPKLIKKPLKKKKQKGWRSYYEWWASKQYYEIWVGKC